ncbi:MULTISPECIES: hypothetical protein [Enterococcus]|uniref:Uncharacterized protein n=1 Tax=Candidatus Enterococcus murrayae TaxID=2815321 RepID=A0ABS3HL33_9ENTE|nr:hypothetical protein [Enterococcus sp. MJM16]MBO0453737.1 hypothetical protein [Enterococcus sp. MJM16]
MFDEKKVLLQLNTAFGLIAGILMMNTIALIGSLFFNAFGELSFFMWAFVTFMGWVVTIIQFKKADIQVKWKK